MKLRISAPTCCTAIPPVTDFIFHLFSKKTPSSLPVENARTKVTLHCAEAIASAEETDLLENPIEGALGVKENEIELTIKPYEIRTIRIRTAK